MPCDKVPTTTFLCPKCSISLGYCKIFVWLLNGLRVCLTCWDWAMGQHGCRLAHPKGRPETQSRTCTRRWLDIRFSLSFKSSWGRLLCCIKGQIKTVGELRDHDSRPLVFLSDVLIDSHVGSIWLNPNMTVILESIYNILNTLKIKILESIF